VAGSPLPRGAERAAGALHRFEDALLALLLGAMIVLAPLQILLRGVLGTGLAWVDPMLRVLVLWVGLFGAVVACREGRHITIDVLARLLGGRASAAAGALTSLFTAGVAGVVSYHGGRFVASEREFASIGFSGIPAWALELVIPVAFAVIALRYLGLAGSHLRALVRGESGASDAGSASA
jgi:TRAP-type C4-dicarboxylate transport system permease small subunit